jgi:hypothetical protein
LLPVAIFAPLQPVPLSFPHFQLKSGDFAMPKPRLSLDVWAVVLSLVLALAVRLGAIKTVPW